MKNKKDNKMVCRYIHLENPNEYAINSKQNYVPLNENANWKLNNAAMAFMGKFNIKQLTIYVPDSFVNSNFVEINNTLTDEE